MRPHLTGIRPLALVLLYCCAALALALALAPRAAAAAADDVDRLLRESREAFRAGDNEQAVELAGRAIAADPKNPAGYLLRATVREGTHDLEKALEDYEKLIELDPADANHIQRRGSAHLRAGHFEAAVRDFDKFIELEPREAPHHWQRGIACYYAGRYEDGREQFELHQTVNRNDVENAAWHFLCVARAEGAEAARSKLIPISGDPRVPMAEVHALFAGRSTPADVLAAARAGDPAPAELAGRLFYAHLYLGLYFEATGDAERAREHVDLAAGKHRQPHYMGDIARVHAATLRRDGRAPGGADDRSKPDAPASQPPPGEGK